LCKGRSGLSPGISRNSGKALLLVSNEVSSTTTIWQIE